MSEIFKYFKNLFIRERKGVSQKISAEQELTNRLKPYERLLYSVQDIIIWKDSSLSTLSLFVIHLFFWLTSYFEWRFFGLVFLLFSGILINDVWFNYIWPEIKVKNKDVGINEEMEINPEGLLTLPQLSHYAAGFQSAISVRYKKLKYLRATQPAVFCVVCSLFSLLVAGLGTFLPTLVLLYILSVGLFTLPGIYIHLVTPSQKQVINSALFSIYSIIMPPESSMNVDEYMPDVSQENLDILSKAGNNSNDLSTPSSESSMVDLIPYHDESSQGTLDSFSLPPVPDGSETDSDGDALSIKNNQLTESSSGEEEPSLIQNLAFPELDTASQPGRIASALSGVFYKTFPAISGRLQFRATGEGVHSPQTSRDDSDSEFEIIDEDS